MIFWKHLRLIFLFTIFSTVLGVLVKSVLFPAPSKITTPLGFPVTLPLQGWQLLQSSPLVDSIGDRIPPTISARHYQYVNNDLSLDIKMRYFVNTNGEVKDFIKSYESISVSSLIRQKEGIGFYALFTYKDRAYLSACINPYGSSTVTARQFQQNHNFDALQFNRLLPWLLSQENLKDERCLWAYLSVPLKQSSPEVAYQSLENVWFSWYKWWNSRFPKA
ncbi:cyanoexosortase A system-associated protein [Aerosakkonemataceae cyanobacterium BLCC-F50]|uniref:Cyanoexosortase A system-associated protein n=1 Tax=Floridaenema flaviceps BLCC-F50 TaxID=3153642 RepID=A0ABV4XRV7_9CYAN